MLQGTAEKCEFEVNKGGAENLSTLGGKAREEKKKMLPVTVTRAIFTLKHQSIDRYLLSVQFSRSVLSDSL